MIVPESAPATPEVGLGRLLRAHSAGCDRRRSALALDDHHRRVDSRELHRSVENAVHHLLEVDRATELAKEAIPARLALRAVERLREIVRQLVHLVSHLVDGTHELRAFRGRRSIPPSQHEKSEHRRQQDGGDENHRSCHLTEPFLREP